MNQLNKFIGQIAANVHEVENECPVVGLAGCHLTENSKIAGTSLSVPSVILGSYEELRWMEPHMSSPSPCCDNTDEKFYIYSDVPHTHTPPGGAFFRKKCEAEQKVRSKDGYGSLCTYAGQAAALSSRRKIAR